MDARDEARARWRSASDRLWPVALADPETYRQAAELVGTLLEALRRDATSVEDLHAVDADPSAVLAVLPAGAAAAWGGPGVLLAAACAVRVAELDAERARADRVARIDEARRAGDEWVELADPAGGGARSVEMHLGSGLALVATADPYAGPEPYLLGEAVLDPCSGEPRGGPAAGDVAFGAREDWLAARDRRRAEIVGRLDAGGRDGLR